MRPSMVILILASILFKKKMPEMGNGGEQRGLMVNGAAALIRIDLHRFAARSLSEEGPFSRADSAQVLY